MNEEEKLYDEILSKIGMLDNLYNNDFVTLEEYWKIKNRMIDRLITVRDYYKEIIKEKSEDEECRYDRYEG